MDRVPLPCAGLFRWPGFQRQRSVAVAGRRRSIPGRNSSGNQLRAGSVPGRGQDLYDALPRFRPNSSVERDPAVGGQERGTGDRGTTRFEEHSGGLSFCLSVDATYEVSGGHLTIDYTVGSGASNTSEMIFSIGNHIAFKLPFVKGSDPAKMTLETPSTVQRLRNAKGVLSGEEKPRSFQTPEALGSFDARVAIPLSGYRSQPYARLVDPQGVSLRLTQQASSTPAGTAGAIQPVWRAGERVLLPGAHLRNPELPESRPGRGPSAAGQELEVASGTAGGRPAACRCAAPPRASRNLAETSALSKGRSGPKRAS